MHSLHVYFKLLRLAEFLATNIAEGPGSARVGGTAVGAMHVQVVEPKKVLQNKTKNYFKNVAGTYVCT